MCNLRKQQGLNIHKIHSFFNDNFNPTDLIQFIKNDFHDRSIDIPKYFTVFSEEVIALNPIDGFLVYNFLTTNLIRVISQYYTLNT
jgi:hypothetical protein